ncbi:MAG: choline/carnitine O-acyltransferase [Thermovirgaceae bacterium]
MGENKNLSKTRQLPRLRFPDLRKTCEDFVDWSAPFLNGTELAETDRVVRDFLAPHGPGHALQRALEETLQEDPSFLGHIPYWNRWYLAQDAPLGFETNPYYLLDVEPMDPLRQAAELTSKAVAFCLSIADGTLEPDYYNGRALCMKQYSSIFGGVRIPREGPDSFTSHASGRCRKELPGHIVVLRGGKIFTLEVLDDEARPCGTDSLEKAFHRITELPRNPQIHAGVLTTLKRHEWAHLRNDLLKAHKNNEEALKSIESALFAVCLDDAAPADIEEAGRLLLSGNNRWYDKTLQIVVFRDGQAGINFEHSHLDGLPLTRLARTLAQKATKKETTTAWIPSFREVPLALTTKLRGHIERADRKLEKRVSKLGTRLLELPVGKGDIKRCGVSPDAFVQIALLLACRNHWGRWVSTSEAVMLRLFEGGRTGVMRTLTPAALAFFTLLESPAAASRAQAEALRKASEAHARRINLCLEGHAPEEHLQALLAVHLHRGERDRTLPQLFASVSWKRLQETFVATSTTPPEGLRLAGYGPLSEDGFGGRYMKTDPHILFNLSFWRGSASDPESFAESLCSSLEEMFSVFEDVPTEDQRR